MITVVLIPKTRATRDNKTECAIYAIGKQKIMEYELDLKTIELIGRAVKSKNSSNEMESNAFPKKP